MAEDISWDAPKEEVSWDKTATDAPKTIGDRISNAWEKATPGGPLWMTREAIRGMRGAVEGSEAATAPQVGTEEQEFQRRSAEEAGPGKAMQAAQFMTPGAPGGGLFAAPKVPAISEAVPQTAILASERLGVPISRAAVSESPTIQSSAAALKEVPFVGTPLVKSAKKTLEELDTAARDTAAAYGSADTVTGGEAATRGLEKWITEGSRGTSNRLYDRVDQMVDPEFTRDLYATKDAAQSILNRRANANIESPSAAVREVESAITDPGGMNYQGLKDLRTYFRDLTPQEMITKGIQPAEAKQIYRALTEDLRGTILDGGGPQALKSFDDANRVYGIISDRRAALAKIIGKDADASPERVMDRIAQLAGSKGNADANKLIQARRAIGAKDWDEVTSAVVNRMGRSPEAEFSGDRFVTAWDNMSETGKRVLFNSTGKPELAKNVEDIMTLSRSFKQLKQLGNPSGTGRVNAIMSALGALGGAVAGTVTIGLTAPLTILGTALGGRTVSWALSRPVVAKQVKEWSQAYVNAVRIGSPQAVTRLAATSNRLAASMRNQPLTGPVPSAAQPQDNQRSGGGGEGPYQGAGGKSHGGLINRALGGAVNHNHNPTEAQKKAGNYSKTHRHFQGLDITIENLKGKSRSGIGKDGKPWSVSMPAHYGYIKRTEGADGDHVDCYIGPNEKSDQVFVVDQKDAETGRFDEHKCLIGFNSEAEARKTYRAGFSDGKDRIKHLRRMSMAEFKEWLEKGDTSKPIKHLEPRSRGVALAISYNAKRGRDDGFDSTQGR